MKARRRWTSIRWAPLLALTATLAACGPAVTPTDAPPAPASAPTPAPTEPRATCGDSAIRLLGRGAGIHGAIVADTLHMGGAESPVTCADPANLSLEAGLSIPDDYTAQAQQSQSQYYLIVIRYISGNRLYVISRRGDGTTCIVDTNDRCIAQVTELPDDFDLQDLPADVAPTIPAGRPAPELPATTAPAAAGNPQPRDGAAGVAVETLLLSWSAAARAASYDVYWGTGRNLAADAGLGTPIATTSTATTIRRPGATAAERRLALGTTYYWRVDTKNDQGTTRGNVWSFTTADQAAPAPPGGGGYTPPVVSPPTAAPAAAGNPQPRDGATGVAVETLLLSWSAAARAASYDVYWGTGRNLAADAGLGTPIATTFTATTIRRPALGTTYYWRVDAKNGRGTTTGNVWSFTTADQAAPPPPGGGGYTPPVVSPPPAEEPPATQDPRATPDPPPAEETPPAGPPQPAVAPAWPGGAQSFQWVARLENNPVSVAAPTGTPTPVVTTSPRVDTYGYFIGRWIGSFHLDNGIYSIRDHAHIRRGEGVITLTATNSAGTAEKTVSYAISCLNSDAAIADWLKGSAWEPIRAVIGVDVITYVEDTNSWLRRAVFNDNGNGLTVTTRTGTERLTGGVRSDTCYVIHNGTDWGFWWMRNTSAVLREIEGADFQCDGRGGSKGTFSLQRGSRDTAVDLRPAACDDDSPAGVP